MLFIIVLKPDKYFFPVLVRSHYYFIADTIQANTNAFTNESTILRVGSNLFEFQSFKFITDRPKPHSIMEC